MLIIVVVGFVYFFMGEKTTQQMTHEWFFKYPVDTGGIAMAFYNGLFAYSGWYNKLFLNTRLFITIYKYPIFKELFEFPNRRDEKSSKV